MNAYERSKKPAAAPGPSSVAPRIAAAFLRVVLPTELRDDVLGDLQEGFAFRTASSGKTSARRWYWRQTLQSVRYARRGTDQLPDPRPGRGSPGLRRAFMGFFRYDLAYAVRQLRSNPGFTAVAVLSLALGIGVNSTIFTVINGFLMQPLPVKNIDEVVEVYTTSSGSLFNVSAYPDYIDYRDEVTAFESLAANMTMVFNWNRDTNSEMLFGEVVSGNYFEVLGAEPEVGRWFLPEEDRTPATHLVAVLGHGLWQREFGGDPGVVGEAIKLNGSLFTIVGVAPAEFTGTIPILEPDIWTPLMTEPIINFFTPDSSLLEQRGTRSLRMFGRLADGATIEQARAQLATVATRLSAEYPETNEKRSSNVKFLSEVRLHPEIDAAITPVAGLLMGLVGMVLLVACANVANMLLARASARRREIAVRLALGASRWRLVRQLLTESIILSLLGGAVALLITFWVTRLLVSFQPPFPITIVFDVTPDARVLGFTLAASLLTGIVFGLAPALRTSKPDLVGALKEDGGHSARRRFNLRSALVVAQVAVSLVLLVTAGLFARSLSNASSVELGFDEENVAFVSTSMAAAGYELEPGRQFLRMATERVAAIPGVVSAAYTARLPMNLSNANEKFFIEGYEPSTGDGDGAVTAAYNTIGPRYFETLRIPLLAGRELAASDTSTAPFVAIVNKTFADEYWPRENPIGKRIKFDGEDDPWLEIVGVSADYKMTSVGELPGPMVHTAMMQQMPFFETIMVRTSGDPAPMVARMREELQALDSNISFFDARTLSDNMAVVLFPVRMGAALLTAFGLLALSLSAVGVYGVIAYAVSRRTREIGIRIALGAGANDVLGMVIGQGMKVVVVGVVLGMLGALALSSLLGSLLYDVSTLDPVAFLGTAAVLLLVALVANYIPARRGARVDPMVALRSE